MLAESLGKASIASFKDRGLPGSTGSKEPTCNAGDIMRCGLHLGWEGPLEEGLATYSGILVWRIPMYRGTWQATVHGVTKSWTLLQRTSNAFVSEPSKAF